MNPAHLDHEALADLAEGLLDDDHAASANAHLDDCAECRDRSADLADVSRILAEIADIPVPPMPVELAARIDDAIRAESVSTATVASLEHRRGRRHLRTFSAAAAAVVAIGGAAVVGNSLLNGSAEKTSGPTSSLADNPGSNGGSAAAPRKAEGPGSAGVPGERAPGSYKLSSSGTDYRGDTLVRQVSAQLKAEGRAPDKMSAAVSPQIVDCVARLGGGKAPVLVDAARFEGRPATVIAFADKPGSLKILVAGPNCSAQADDLLKPPVVSGG